MSRLRRRSTAAAGARTATQCSQDLIGAPWPTGHVRFLRLSGRKPASSSLLAPAPRANVKRLGNRDEDASARPLNLAANVTLACRIVGQQDIPGTKSPLRSVAALEFDFSDDRQYKLSSRSGVKVQASRGSLAEYDARGRESV